MKKIEYPYDRISDSKVKESIEEDKEELSEEELEEIEEATKLWMKETHYDSSIKVYFVCLVTGDKFIAGKLNRLHEGEEIEFDKPLRVIEIIDESENLIKFASFLQFSKTNIVSIFCSIILYMYEADEEGYTLHEEYREMIADYAVENKFNKFKKKSGNVIGINKFKKKTFDAD